MEDGTLHGLRNDSDDRRASGIVGQEGDIRHDPDNQPFFARAPIQRVIGGIQGLRDENISAIWSRFQAGRVVGISAGVNDISFQGFFILVYPSRSNLYGGFVVHRGKPMPIQRDSMNPPLIGSLGCDWSGER